MKKIDITVSSTLTLNAGNYESVKPSVSLTLKDVPLEDVDRTHNLLNFLVGDLLCRQAAVDTLTVDSIGQIGVRKFGDWYQDHIEAETEKINEKIKLLMEKNDG